MGKKKRHIEKETKKSTRRCWSLIERKGVETNVHGPMERETFRLRFQIGNRNLSESNEIFQ